MAAMQVIDFDPAYADAFRTLNEAWITRYFVLEPRDVEIIGDPQGEIVDKGGHVFIAVETDGWAVGCIAMIPMPDGGFEIAKMAVDVAAQGKGYAKRLLQACIDRARELGAHRLYLESGSILTPALTLYRTFGFKDLRPDQRPNSPYARADVWMELAL
jgi:GNAT superfamily N-acetyltransferase